MCTGTAALTLHMYSSGSTLLPHCRSSQRFCHPLHRRSCDEVVMICCACNSPVLGSLQLCWEDCNSSNAVAYCNRECQRADWRAHKCEVPTATQPGRRGSRRTSCCASAISTATQRHTIHMEGDSSVTNGRAKSTFGQIWRAHTKIRASKLFSEQTNFLMSEPKLFDAKFQDSLAGDVHRGKKTILFGSIVFLRGVIRARTSAAWNDSDS